MSKIINYYNNKNHIDKTWYDSSNVIYSECDDIQNEMKNVRITFKDGSTYEYHDVNVNDYVMFREDSSQGKSINKYIKKYEFEKIDKKDVNELNEELESLLKRCSEIEKENVITIIDDEKITSLIGKKLVDIDISTHDFESKSLVIEVLLSLGIKVKLV